MKMRQSTDKLAIIAHQKVKEWEYWKKQLAGEPQGTGFPYTNNGEKIGTVAGDETGVEKGRLSDALVDRLWEMSNRSDYALHVILTAGVVVLLYKYTGHRDIMIGTPIYKQDVEGDFINTVLPLRIPVQTQGTFKDLLIQTRQTIQEAVAHQSYPIEFLVKQMNAAGPGTADGFRLPETAIVSGNIQEEKDITGLNPSILFSFSRDNRHLEVEIRTRAGLIFQPGVHQIFQHLEHLLMGAAGSVEVGLSILEILSTEEKKQVLETFNQTAVDYPTDKTIPGEITEQAERTPDHVALVGLKLQTNPVGPVRHVQLTYYELNERSEEMAYYLRQKGVEGETITAIMVERSIEMITGILAILKAGGAYLPIDPGYPEDRIDYMLKDSGAKWLVTANHKEGEKVGRWEGEKDLEILFLNFLQNSHLPNFLTSQLPNFPLLPATAVSPSTLTSTSISTCRVGSANLAYVIYTSGSTGKPKGVMIPHRNVVNFIRGMSGGIPFLPGKTILAITTISFDIFVLETLLPLARGMEVLLAAEREQIDPDALAETMLKNCVRMAQFTPSRLKMVLGHREGFAGLRYVSELLVGGEAFPIELFMEVKKFYPGRIFNMYGPTETTVWSAYKELTAAENITIGGPVANTQVYILDAAAAVQPVGVVGELYIGGDGVARGYLNRPELTAEKFCLRRPGTFLKKGSWTSKNFLLPEGHLHLRAKSQELRAKIYRTGDLARWQTNGEIEFLGRSDHQVKIRGFRIELGEIENQLLKCRGIEAAAVIDRDREGKKHLCAYFVSKQKPGISELKSILVKTLPDYMIPSYFIQVEKIPLMLNGKIDRKALESYDMGMKVREEYAAPRDEIEHRMAQLWKEVLNLERVGINENFFDLGGTSLDILRLGVKLEEIFDEKESVVQLFRYPTIITFVEYLGRKKEGKESENDIRRSVSVEDVKKSRQRQKNKRMKGGVSDG